MANTTLYAADNERLREMEERKERKKQQGSMRELVSILNHHVSCSKHRSLTKQPPGLQRSLALCKEQFTMSDHDFHNLDLAKADATTYICAW
jgi:hypothetical protein